MAQNPKDTNGEGKKRPPVLSVTIESQQGLYESYMPFIKSGGLFIPTEEKYQFGDEVFVLLNLAYESERIPIAGTVSWITPKGAHGRRVPGIGIQFTGKDADGVRGKIESFLSDMLQSTKPTHTM